MYNNQVKNLDWSLLFQQKRYWWNFMFMDIFMVLFMVWWGVFYNYTPFYGLFYDVGVKN